MLISMGTLVSSTTLQQKQWQNEQKSSLQICVSPLARTLYGCLGLLKRVLSCVFARKSFLIDNEGWESAYLQATMSPRTLVRWRIYSLCRNDWICVCSSAAFPPCWIFPRLIYHFISTISHTSLHHAACWQDYIWFLFWKYTVDQLLLKHLKL